MGDSIFSDYSFSEFVVEFFRTFGEVLQGLWYAFTQIFHEIGPLKVILFGYVFLLLLGAVSELKKHVRRREAEQRACQAAFEARRAEEQRRKEEREDRISQYRQRERRRGTAKMLTPGQRPQGRMGNAPHSRPGQRGH